MSDAGVRAALDVRWGEIEAYVPQANARKGETVYPFHEMTVGGAVMLVRGRSLYTVRSAIRRYARTQKARDSRFKRKYVARRERDPQGEYVKVWRLA